MTPHLKLSRITKALTDRAGETILFEQAEERLCRTRVAVVLRPPQAATSAGQAAALTAVATAFKCFGSVALCAVPETMLVKPLPIGETVGLAAATLGATVGPEIPQGTTHVVVIGEAATDISCRFAVRCWWDGWIAGVLPAFDVQGFGRSGNPLAGVFAGALAIREVFADILGLPRGGARSSITSLWEPWGQPVSAAPGPTDVYLPPQLWFVGLGHLGQGYLWNLGFLPAAGAAILQDDQTAELENEATGLLTTAADIGTRKTRVAAKWLEGAGWETFLIERRNHGASHSRDDDPPIVLTGLDDSLPRIEIARARFPYMIDAGVGHGSVDFESLQISVLDSMSCAPDPSRLWTAKTDSGNVYDLLLREAYRQRVAEDKCGAFLLAQASVAVPFVGAAVGALVITQAIRLASMLRTCQILTMQLGSPAMARGMLNPIPVGSLGSVGISL